MRNFSWGPAAVAAALAVLLLWAVVSVVRAAIRGAIHGLPPEDTPDRRPPSAPADAEVSDIWRRGSPHHLLSRRMANDPPMHRRVQGLPTVHDEADFHDPPRSLR